MTTSLLKKKKVVFLYQEIAGYILACLAELIRTFPVEVEVMRWDVNEVAPFIIEPPPGVTFHNRKDFDSESMITWIKSVNPELIFCGGWVDKDYLRVVKVFHETIPTVLGMDNHWRGDFRQVIMTFLGGRYISRLFRYIWIPGIPQYEFARRMGFSADRIRLGLYCCDYDIFNGAWMGSKEEKRKKFPHRFFFVGRFTQKKGLDYLLDAFLAAAKKTNWDWELVLVGKGEMENDVPEHPLIRRTGFLQPNELAKMSKEGGVFVLPSLYEAWGVVVQEFCAAGFPIVCSFGVGAATSFLHDGFNGYYHLAGDTASLQLALEKIASSDDSRLWEMGKRSADISANIQPASWAAELWELITAGY